MDLPYLETAIHEQARRAAVLAFLIFCIYAVLRYVIYEAIPVNDFTDWVIRDTIMNGARLLVLYLSLKLGLKTWGKRGLGLHAEGFQESLRVAFIFFLLLWCPDHWLRSEPYNLSNASFLVLTGSSLLVALWEEILYRGVFFNAHSRLERDASRHLGLIRSFHRDAHPSSAPDEMAQHLPLRLALRPHARQGNRARFAHRQPLGIRLRRLPGRLR